MSENREQSDPDRNSSFFACSTESFSSIYSEPVEPYSNRQTKVAGSGKFSFNSSDFVTALKQGRKPFKSISDLKIRLGFSASFPSVIPCELQEIK